MASEVPAVRCTRLVRIYRSATGETHALRGVDAVFPGGLVTAVTGPSGSGKSSLLSVLALRERQSGGEVWVGSVSTAAISGRRLRELRRRHVGWVAQRPTHSLFPHLSALEHLEMAARLRGSAFSPDLLERLELADRGRARIGELSGGEQQRLAVAVALVGDPPLVVADEPTAELDDVSARLVLDELRRCAAQGTGVLFATHDHRAIDAADRELRLRHGVLSGESLGAGPVVATIDPTGRVQLPPEALARFPEGRAVISLEPGGDVRLRPPGGA
jgi:ABC-type lipoprotein export system ATPase subunit